MTLLHLTIDEILRFLQISGTITCTWPRNFKVGKLAFIFGEIAWILAILGVGVVQMGLVCALYQYNDDITTIMKALSQFNALLEVTSNLIICKWKSVHIQNLLEEIKDFYHTSNDREKIILQKYIDRYSNFALLVVISHILAILIFSCGPLFLPITFPAEGWYPFPTESWPVITVIYIIQIYSIVQSGLGISIDFTFSIFMFYTSTKLEILCLKIQDAKNKWQMNLCIQEHQKIIEFVNKTNNTIKYSLFKTNITMALAAIFGAFPIISRQSFFITSQFICMLLGAAQRLYITAWPADDLKENSESIATAVYNMLWIGKPRTLTQNISFVMQRTQKPLMINMGSFLSNLSLRYYANYLATMFSYFTTVKTVIGDFR